MFMQSIYKKAKERGAAIIEYALLLAFVAIIGSALLMPNSIPDSISKVIDRIEELLDGEASGGDGGEEEGPTEPEEKPDPEPGEPGEGGEGGSENPDVPPPTAEQEQEAIDKLGELKKQYDALNKKEDKEEAESIREQYKSLYHEYKKKGYDLNGIPGDPHGDGQWNKKNK